MLLTFQAKTCRIPFRRVVSSGEERFLDAEEVRGSNPLPPTILEKLSRLR